MNVAYPILTLLLAGSAVVARADVPVRTVVYHFAIDSRGFGSAPSMGGGSLGGMVMENSTFGTSGRTGTIKMDVIRATGDGGMVVDVTEHVDRELRDMQTVRCAVYGKSQSVICDQSLSATPEETVLLQYVGRYFYPESPDGGHWHVQVPSDNAKIDNDYTVTKNDGKVLTIAVDRTMKALSSTSHTTGTIRYDAALEIPDYVKTATSLQRDSNQGDTNVELRILSDSMAPQTSQTSH